MNPLVSAYRPGTTWLHRLRAGAKVGLLAAYSVVTVVIDGWASGLVFVAVSMVVAISAGLRPREIARALRPLLWVVVIVGAFQTWQRGWPVAVHVLGDLVALVLAAVVLTATTPVDELLDTVVRWLGPFQRVGVKPERVALAFSLMLRAIPDLMEIARESRDAAKARGLERNVRARFTPLAIRAVARAYDTGDALAARGLGDPDPRPGR